MDLSLLSTNPGCLECQMDEVVKEKDEKLSLETNKYTDPTRKSTISAGLVTLYQFKHFVDVTLVAGNKELECHRNILAISSPYFMTMFLTGLAEGQQKKIHIKEMDGGTLEMVLNYIYLGEVMLSTDNVQNVLSAANLFQIMSLREGCADFMIKHINVSNCIGVYFFAKAHQCERLAAKAKELINSQFETLSREPEFYFLPADKLVELITDDQICIRLEENLFEACMAWINYSLEERKQHLYTVIKCVRFAIISPYYFCDKIDCIELLNECEPLSEVMRTVRYFHTLRNRQSEIDLNDLPRSGMSYERGIVIIANPYAEENSQKFNCMDVVLPSTGEIKFICKLPQSLFMPGTCSTGDNQIYVAGGALRKLSHNRNSFIPEGISSNLFLFDNVCRSWHAKSRMNHARCQFNLVVVDSCLFAVGGRDEDEFLDSVEKYDLQTNNWSFVSPLPNKLRCMTSVSYKGKLFVFGGESLVEVTNACFCYDPAIDTWSKLPSMTHSRALAGSVVHQNKIYVIGGNSTVSTKWKKEFLPEHCIVSVEIYDPVANSWSKGPDLPNALCGAGVVKYGDAIILIGGEDDKSWMAGMYTLEDKDGQQSWVAGVELPIVMSTFGCVVANIPKDHLD